MKRYGQVTAVNGIDIHVKTGEMVALLGPNGAGKSRTIGMMLGLLRPDAGRVDVLGGSPEATVRAGRIANLIAWPTVIVVIGLLTIYLAITLLGLFGIPAGT